MEVYIDVLFAVNFFMDLFILWSVSFIGCIDTSLKKTVLASALGAFLYCCTLYGLKYCIPANIASCLIILSAMAYIAFRPKSIKELIKSLMLIYVFTITFGGLCYRLYGLCGNTGFQLKILIISSVFVYITIKTGIGYIDRYIVKRRNYGRVTVYIEGQKISLTALEDTGCNIKGSRGEAVILAEIKAIKSLYKGAVDRKRFCIIPFKSLGADNGIIYGIRTDFAYAGGKIIPNAILALYNGQFSGGEYNAIVSPDIFKEGDYSETA